MSEVKKEPAKKADEVKKEPAKKKVLLIVGDLVDVHQKLAYLTFVKKDLYKHEQQRRWKDHNEKELLNLAAQLKDYEGHKAVKDMTLSYKGKKWLLTEDYPNPSELYEAIKADKRVSVNAKYFK